MNSFDVANRQVRPAADALPAKNLSQRLAKSFDPNGSALFSKTLTDVQTAPHGVRPGSSATVATASVRHNIVTAMTNSSIATPATPPAPTVSTASGAAQTMTKEQARQILATGQGDVVTANQVYYGTQNASGSQGTSVSAIPSGPPTSYAPGQTLSTDPAMFTSSNYIEGLNLSTYQQQANWENTRRYQNYQNEFQNWQLNGSQGAPPAQPQYETVDQAGFQKWWTQYQANIASGNGSAPDVSMFIANAPGQLQGAQQS